MSLSAFLDYSASLIQNNAGFAPLMAFLAGVATSFTPCSVSGIPLLIGYIGGTNTKDERRALKLSVIFAFGGALTYTALGFAISLTGSLVSFSSYWYIALGVLMIMMFLQMMDIYVFIPSANFISRDIKKGYIGALIAGCLSGLFSSPCSTPVLVVILSIAAKSGDVFYGGFLLLAYSAGHSILLVISGTSVSFANRLLQNRAYTKVNQMVKYAISAVILLIAFYMFYLGF